MTARNAGVRGGGANDIRSSLGANAAAPEPNCSKEPRVVSWCTVNVS